MDCGQAIMKAVEHKLTAVHQTWCEEYQNLANVLNTNRSFFPSLCWNASECVWIDTINSFSIHICLLIVWLLVILILFCLAWLLKGYILAV